MEYWIKRELEHMTAAASEDYYENYYKRLAGIYTAAEKDARDAIDAFQVKSGMSWSFFSHYGENDDLAEYEAWAKEYVADKNFSPIANLRMKHYNTVMIKNRNDLLKAQIDMMMLTYTDRAAKEGEIAQLTESIAEYQRQAGILGETVPSPEQLFDMATAVARGSFREGTFSDRIWANHDLLIENLNHSLTTSLIRGLNPKEVARTFKKLFQSTTYEAERLARTELQRVQSDTQKMAYDRYGYEEYLFVAEPDACEHCLALDDGTPKKTKKMAPGINASPIHPNCRCSVVPYMDRDEAMKQVEALTGVDMSSRYRAAIDKAHPLPAIDKFVRSALANATKGTKSGTNWLTVDTRMPDNQWESVKESGRADRAWLEHVYGENNVEMFVDDENQNIFYKMRIGPEADDFYIFGITNSTDHANLYKNISAKDVPFVNRVYTLGEYKGWADMSMALGEDAKNVATQAQGFLATFGKNSRVADLQKKSLTYKTFDDFIRAEKESLTALGLFNPEGAEGVWRDARYANSLTKLKALTLEEAEAIAFDNISQNDVDGWFRNADSDYKPRLERAIINNPELRNATLNIAYKNYIYATGDNITFEQFLTKDITVYRAGNVKNFIDNDTFISFSFSEDAAKKFGDNVVGFTIKPIDTLGSLLEIGEAELMVPRGLVDLDELKLFSYTVAVKKEQYAALYDIWKTNKMTTHQLADMLLKNEGWDIKTEGLFENSGVMGQTGMPINSAGFIKFDSFALYANDTRSIPERIQVIFHELFHAKADGLLADAIQDRTDALDAKLAAAIATRSKKVLSWAEWSYVDDLYAEISSAYWVKDLGIYKKNQGFMASYAEYVVKSLPKLKMLEQYAEADNFYDFGKLFAELRFDSEKKAAVQALHFDDYKYLKSTPMWKADSFEDLTKYLERGGYLDYIRYNKDDLAEAFVQKEGLQRDAFFNKRTAAELTEVKYSLKSDMDAIIDKMLDHTIEEDFTQKELSILYGATSVAMDDLGVLPYSIVSNNPMTYAESLAFEKHMKRVEEIRAALIKQSGN
jgi:SPP1 gp7 family putative phage head morphogenesis protein